MGGKISIFESNFFFKIVIITLLLSFFGFKDSFCQINKDLLYSYKYLDFDEVSIDHNGFLFSSKFIPKNIKNNFYCTIKYNGFIGHKFSGKIIEKYNSSGLPDSIIRIYCPLYHIPPSYFPPYNFKKKTKFSIYNDIYSFRYYNSNSIINEHLTRIFKTYDNHTIKIDSINELDVSYFYSSNLDSVLISSTHNKQILK